MAAYSNNEQTCTECTHEHIDFRNRYSTVLPSLLVVVRLTDRESSCEVVRELSGAMNRQQANRKNSTNAGTSCSPVLALGGDAELLDLALDGGEALGGGVVEEELGLDELVQVLDRLRVLEHGLHEGDGNLRLLDEVILRILNLQPGSFLL